MYCASGPTHPELLALAAELGEAIAERGWTLVSGGGKVSAMGALASAARARGGHTVGVIPEMLVRPEVADTDADELIVTAQIYDHAARLRSFEIAAQVRDELAADAKRGGPGAAR